MTSLIKICGMTDKAAVDAAVAAGADAVGFVFYAKSPRNLLPEQARELAKGVPAHVRRVAVLLHPSAALWNEVQAIVCPDVVQTDAADFSYLTVADGIEKWPVLREGAVQDDTSLPDVFVYEGQKSGQGEKVSWKFAADIAKRGKMILAGGLTVENVGDAIVQVEPFGVDVSSAVESQRGIKDVAKIAAFIAAAKAASKQNRK